MAGKKTLDRQRTYGTVHGDLEGRHFEQDGVIYDAQGNEWIPPTVKTDVELEAEREATRIADEAEREAAVNARVAAILAEKGLGPDGKALVKPKG